jgi:hypothetical protein
LPAEVYVLCTIGNVARAVFRVLLVALVVLQLMAPRSLERQRAGALSAFESERHSRVIAIIKSRLACQACAH